MALECFVGTFRSLTTDAVNTDYTLTPGFQAKAGLVFHTGRGEATDTVGGATHRTGIGMFTSTTNRFCCGYMSVDAAAAGSGNEFARGDAICATYATDSTTLDGRIDVQAISATQVTFRVLDVMPVDTTCGVIVWGGTDITNAIVVEFDHTTGTGTMDVTTVGFQGDVFFFMGVDEIVNAPTADAAGAQLFFAACTGSTDEHAWWGGQDQGSASADTGGYCLAGECLLEWGGAINSPGAAGNRAEFSTALSNGFRINKLITTRAGVNCYALVIKGGSWAVNNFTTRTTTGTIVRSSLPFTPKGLIVVSALRAVSTSPNSTVHDQLSFGATDGTTHHVQSHVDEDGPANMEVGTGVDFDKVYQNIDTADAKVGDIDWTSFDSGGWTLTQNDADPVANFCFDITCGNSPAGFDTALMAAMQHREPRVANPVEVVAGGMSPPEFIPT